LKKYNSSQKSLPITFGAKYHSRRCRAPEKQSTTGRRYFLNLLSISPRTVTGDRLLRVKQILLLP
jgi:hypothetical protein